MATRHTHGGASALPTPQQPDLRAFILYDRIPAGCIAFPITDDDSAPLLRAGDVALIDTTDRDPAEHELFGIQWNCGARSIVELWALPGRYSSGPNGEMIDSRGWWAGPYNRPRSRQALASTYWARRPVPCSDGPYASEGPNAGYLPSKLLGRVVGILEPRFEEPRRLEAQP